MTGIRMDKLLALIGLGLAASLAGVPRAQELPDKPPIHISLSASAQEAKTGYPVDFTLTIRNLSDEEVSVRYPLVPQMTVIPAFKDLATGKTFGPSVKWLVAPFSETFTIQPRESYQCAIYLEELFPSGMPPGSYEVWFKYNPGDRTWLETNRLQLRVHPLSKEDVEERAQARQVVHGNREERARRTLALREKYPNSKFLPGVRLESGIRRLKRKRHQDAENALQMVLDNPNASSYQKRQANFYMARSLRDRGELGKAIPFLEAVGTPWAAREAESLRRQIAATKGEK